MLLFFSLNFAATFFPFSPGQKPHGRLVPPTMVVKTTRILGSVMLGRWVDYKYASGEREKVVFGKGIEVGVPLGLKFFPQEVAGGDDDNDAMVEVTIYLMDNSSPGLSFQITTTLYRAEGSLEDYGFKVHEDESEEEDAEGDDDGDVAVIGDGSHWVPYKPTRPPPPRSS